MDESDNDWPTCLADVSKIVELSAKITADIKKFNFVQLVKDINELYNVV